MERQGMAPWIAPGEPAARPAPEASTAARRRRSARACAVGLGLAMLASHAAAADWPQYRGPGRDGRSAETGLLRSWPAAGPRVLWRVRLGDGYSGIAVAAGRVYTMYGNGTDELVLCLAAADGKEIWRYRTDADRPDGQGSGPRSTPTVDGDTVYALGASGQLVALEAATGIRRWGVDLARELGGRVPSWGVSTSPLVEGGKLLVDVGGRGGRSLVAFDKRSGKVLWTSGDEKPGYSSPLAVTVGGLRQVLFFTGSALVSASPDDGRVFWREPWKTSWDVNAAMPIFLPPDKVFVSSGYDTGAAVLAIRRQGDGATATAVWRSRVMKNHFNSSVLVGDHLYGFDNATLKCIRAANGEEVWAQRGFQKGSLLYADGHLVILSERGLLALVEATPEGFREKARAQVLEGKTWTMPTLADGTLYVRSEKELLALKVSG